MVLLFLFKQYTNDKKSYQYEVSLTDIHSVYIYIHILISFKLNYILYKNMLIEKLLSLNILNLY